MTAAATMVYIYVLVLVRLGVMWLFILHARKQRDVCADYLELVRDFGIETSCGFRNPYTELEPHRVRVEFRSNTR